MVLGTMAAPALARVEWMAPKQFDSSIGQDYRLDSFALGLLLLALRSGRRPF